MATAITSSGTAEIRRSGKVICGGIDSPDVFYVCYREATGIGATKQIHIDTSSDRGSNWTGFLDIDPPTSDYRLYAPSMCRVHERDYYCIIWLAVDETAIPIAAYELWYATFDENGFIVSPTKVADLSTATTIYNTDIASYNGYVGATWTEFVTFRLGGAIQIRYATYTADSDAWGTLYTATSGINNLFKPSVTFIQSGTVAPLIVCFGTPTLGNKFLGASKGNQASPTSWTYNSNVDSTNFIVDATSATSYGPFVCEAASGEVYVLGLAHVAAGSGPGLTVIRHNPFAITSSLSTWKSPAQIVNPTSGGPLGYALMTRGYGHGHQDADIIVLKEDIEAAYYLARLDNYQTLSSLTLFRESYITYDSNTPFHIRFRWENTSEANLHIGDYVYQGGDDNIYYDRFDKSRPI